MCEEFGLTTHTAALAVQYYDMYSCQQGEEVARDTVLVGSACVLLASKFLEKCVPAIDSLSQASDRPAMSLRATEKEVLRALNWELYVPTAHTFHELLLSLLQLSDERFVKRSEWICDMSMYVDRIIEFKPIVVAASSILLSWRILEDAEAESRNTAELCKLCDADLVRSRAHSCPLHPSY